MDLSLINQLIQADDPLHTLYEALTEEIWTTERFLHAQKHEDLHGYLREGEHAASGLEREIHAIYGDVYELLEAEDPRRDRVQNLHEQGTYTLLLIDGLSLRELPLILETLASHGFASHTDFALAPLPSETTDFARRHYEASGPSEIARREHRYSFAFRHVASEDWEPNFSVNERQRFIWYAFPDDYFGLKETEYGRHVVHPIETILAAVLQDSDLILPLVITGDHGYLWQGDQCPWPVDDSREQAVLAEHFKLGRCTRAATESLAQTGKAWVSGSLGAARGRFAWGSVVPGPTALFKHGGISLLECLVPWITVT